VKLFYSSFQIVVTPIGSLDDQQRFRVLNDFAFPAIDGFYSFHNVDAGRELLGHQRVRDSSSLLFARSSYENNQFVAHSISVFPYTINESQRRFRKRALKMYRRLSSLRFALRLAFGSPNLFASTQPQTGQSTVHQFRCSLPWVGFPRSYTRCVVGWI
jgi:hypothetical protein